MGYYSYYSLEVKVNGDGFIKEDIIADLINGNDEAASALHASGETLNEAKWYQFEDDMKSFSEKYLDVLFIVLRTGQTLGDIGKSYFKNGEVKSFQGKITYPTFKDNQLEEYTPFSIEPDVVNDVDGCSFTLLLNGEQSLIKDLRESYPEAHSALDENGKFYENKEWLSHESNLVEFSKKHPTIHFVLYCKINYEDDEINNMNSLSQFWRKNFKGGKIHRANAVWRF